MGLSSCCPGLSQVYTTGDLIVPYIQHLFSANPGINPALIDFKPKTRYS